MTCEARIHIVVVRLEFDISVSHLYKWALRVAESCVFSASPGQPKRGEETKREYVLFSGTRFSNLLYTS